uniref:NADH-ubiquinone oxidoreductase chain 4L n=1 Tax=Lycodon ruhstrati TaxID=591072 RepID=A0A0U1TE48_9SAUR|nr:NADH dehydrogenase subunit 4L [Lycodon ruhstrati]AHV78301.1 NADH dehydrogenase subunit 4L [Lycodon ruhstrati]QHS71276.1 NADH dehydrogenase subunit 4L [Lycodon ruhstrati]
MELMKMTMYATFMITIITLSLQQKHLMLALMCVETMMLIVFTMLVTFNSASLATTQTPMPIILLTISVCGAAVGLSLVVAITRTHGSDFLKNLSLL